MSASREPPEILTPAEARQAEPPMCDECCRDVGGEFVRVESDGRLLCYGCDPSVPEP